MDRPPDSPCVPPAASAPANATASCRSSSVRKGTSAPTICSISSAARTAGIGRATVYRTLQWMVDAGIARKVDFGEGRSRFEPSYRHPRHFHLICTTCHSLVGVSELGRRGADRGDRRGAQFRADAGDRPDLRHLRGVPHRHARRRRSTARRPSWCSRATRCAWRSPPSAAASSSTRAPPALTKDPRGRDGVPEARRRGARAPRHAREALPRADRRAIRSSSRGRRSCSSRARPAACSPRAPKQLRDGVDDQQALLIGIKCERGSHKFFKRYGERFEDSEGKQIFLEFADEERDAPRPADARVPRAARAPGRRPRARRRARAGAAAPMIDLHTHTTASDGRCTPAELVARAAAAGVTVLERHRSRHRRRLRGRGRRLRAPPASSSSPASRSPRCATASTSTCSATSSTRSRRRCRRFSPSSASAASTASRQMIARLAALGIRLDADAILQPGARRSAASRSAGRGSRARWSRPAT